MRLQQGERKHCGIKAVLASDQFERRSLRQFVALMWSDLVASRTLVLGDVLATRHIRPERGCRAEGRGDQDTSK
jgi:hypothetical protein